MDNYTITKLLESRDSYKLKKILSYILESHKYSTGALFLKLSTTNTYKYIIGLHENIIVSYTLDPKIKQIVNPPHKLPQEKSINISNTIEDFGLLIVANPTVDFKVLDKLPYSICQFMWMQKCQLDEKYISNLQSMMNTQLQNPLNEIIGYIQLLSKSDLNKTQTFYIKSISKYGIKLLNAINNIIDFYRLSNNTIKINLSLFQLDDIVQEISNTIVSKFNDKNQQLTFSIDDNIPKFILTDRKKLIQVIINLLDNSSKFTKYNGSVSVTFSCCERNTLTTYVKDTGIGMKKAELDEILLFLLDDTNNLSNSQKQGFGLSIVKKIVRLMDGLISVSSVEGKGSTFTFNFKIEGVRDFNFFRNSFRGDNILLMCLNTKFIKKIRSICLKHNIELVVADTDLEFMRLFFTKSFSYIFLDESRTELLNELQYDPNFSNLITIVKKEKDVDGSNLVVVDMDIPSILEIMFKLKTKKYLNYSYGVVKKDYILLVDDYKFNTQMLASMLEYLGYTNVERVDSGIMAVDQLSSTNKYKLIFFDIEMSTISACDLIKSLKHLKLDIAMAVVSNTDDITNLEFDYFLEKPIYMNNLLQICEQVFKNKE